jgi:hypothetical protein
MSKVGFRLLIVGTVLAISLHAVPAYAQATRTWVSGVGDDANPCSRTAPCKTFAGAISKTAAKGEINVLDPGGFGGVTITKSISIISTVEAGVLVSGTNAIIVNLPNSADVVVLEGLDIEGLGTGIDGIRIIGSGETIVRKTSIRNFTGNGINLVGTANARLYVQDSFIFNCGSNAGNGLKVQGAGAAINTAFLQNTLLEFNFNNSVNVIGPSTLVLMGSTLSGTSVSIAASGGASVVSYGNNIIRGSGLPTSTLPLQ